MTTPSTGHYFAINVSYIYINSSINYALINYTGVWVLDAHYLVWCINYSTDKIGDYRNRSESLRDSFAYKRDS